MNPQPPPKLPPETRLPLEAHWARFVAWCTVTGDTPLPATPATIEQFLTAFPGAASTQRLRRHAIRHHHLVAGYSDPIPVAEDRVWPRVDALNARAVGQVLQAIPKYRYPIGLRGRRDAFLIVLVGILHLTRNQARMVTAADVTVTSIVRIRGNVVPSADDAAACAACAVTRWLRIIGPVWSGFRGDVIRLLDPTRGNLDQHDCEQPLSGQWRRAEQLLLPLDVHGWARTGVALSSRSVTAIVPSRREAADGEVSQEAVGPATRVPSRFNDLSLEETYAELGIAEAAVNTALDRLAAVWRDAQALDSDLEKHTVSPRRDALTPDSDD